MKLGDRVRVYHDENPFTGTIERVIHWTSPLAIVKQKGTDYVVRADDDNKLYRCPAESITKLK